MSNNAPDYENNLAFDPDINTMPRCDIEALKSEIKRLKELLREWIHFYPIILYEHEDTLKTRDIIELYDKTANAIGEKQPSFKDYITEDQLKQLKGGA